MSTDRPIQLLPWDSDFLGFRVARAEVANLSLQSWQRLLASAQADDYRLLYVVADPSDDVTAATLSATGLNRISRLVTYVATAEKLATPSAEVPIESTTQMTPGLEALAWESGAYSRFRLDAQMPPPAFRRLYSEWLRKSLRGEQVAREVFVAHAPLGNEIGLLTLGTQEGRADVGLLAVAAAHRGAGVGQALLVRAAQRTREWGLRQLQVVTQVENEPACRFYTRMGFRAAHQQDIYHCWLA